ncbi:UDP-N-acetylmuramate dehydrogenase [Cnuella takakiae]|uniref:UDP-N-acetylenolpyruvoylglucosamine reductase n=1 Tax=Cnuella takakiae TaxID=1302690 RepID=A0A1M5BBD4_9BACT|nr:UDP-N-acetylmuramate dehydrogenase [Cnuella takakiae]OLY93414.1 UDP-N-acetylenolpyruvoylglucosamine reductase [Cnuella takakiae]SHF39696.1 UDP-N-acetylmuramate dehydrogenase [Cnuella takakiae]
MLLQENISLKPFNTFGIEASARYFASFHNLDELGTLLHANAPGQDNRLILGGGSNILLTRNFDGLVLQNKICGIEKVGEDDTYVYVKAGAGENWHQFVLHCITQGYAGVENLSLIPGSVGASPMQNIGAYGVEIKDVFHELEAWHIQDRQLQTFTLAECRFGYRESVFKHQYKGQFVITSVTYRLRKTPQFNISYGAIQQELDAMGVKELSIGMVSQAVINIRSSKLPDWKQVGNAGSFFKNPVITNEQFQPLKAQFPAIVAFPSGPNHTKLAAGWLIEQCGWKGVRRGDAGCYPKQALVLVNYGQATGAEVYALSAAIIRSVEDKFGVTLEREVNII